MNSLEQVAEFHKLFQHPILDTPQIPDQKRCALREALIEEELNELRAAIAAKDIVGVADALCDLQYVLSGAVLEFGLKDVFPAMFDEVQRSNMSKACSGEEEARETMQKYIREDPALLCDVHAEEKDGKYFVYRTHDRKILKSKFYSPANLKKFL